MDTFLENDAPLVNHLFSLYNVHLFTINSKFGGFGDGILVKIVPVPSNCLLFTSEEGICTDPKKTIGKLL